MKGIDMIIHCRRITGVLAVAILFLCGSSGYGQLESCRCQTESLPEDSKMTWDWTAFDTCGANLIDNDCHSVLKQLSYNELESRLYGRGPWLMQFKDSTFSIPQAPPDSILYVDWRIINPKYSALRNALSDLEQQFGVIQLQKVHPSDNSGELAQLFRLRFDIAGSVHALTMDSIIAALPEIGWSSRYFGIRFSWSVPELSDSTAVLHIEVSSNQRSLIVYPDSKYVLGNVVIVNSLGSQIAESEIHSTAPMHIDISRLANGVYFIRSKTSFARFYIAK